MYLEILHQKVVDLPLNNKLPNRHALRRRHEDVCAELHYKQMLNHLILNNDII